MCGTWSDLDIDTQDICITFLEPLSDISYVELGLDLAVPSVDLCTDRVSLYIRLHTFHEPVSFS
jgi:hypothetical protein